MRMNFGKVMLVGLALLCGTGMASAAAFPDRPIQFIVPYSAGGATISGPAPSRRSPRDSSPSRPSW